MTKIVYFDVENDEYDYLKNQNDGKYDYFLTGKSLNNLDKIPEEYKDADVISCFTTSRVGKDVLEKFSKLLPSDKNFILSTIDFILEKNANKDAMGEKRNYKRTDQ